MIARKRLNWKAVTIQLVKLKRKLMSIPPSLRISCEVLLAEARVNAGFILTLEDSRDLFEPVDFPKRSSYFNWLGILTAQFVLPNWVSSVNKNKKDSKIPLQMVDMAINLLQQSEKVINSAQNAEADEFYWFRSRVREQSTKDVYKVAATAGNALSNVLNGNSLRNVLITTLCGLDAYTIEDENSPGVWFYFEDEEGIRWRNIKGHQFFEAHLQYYKPTQKNPAKAIKFWEWWLTEAIPQAWAMVEE